MTIQRIISGGQTGADRGGLDAAIELSIPHGGFCPAGRRAEDGCIPEQYHLEETASAHYPVRTRKNVYAADATVVFTHGNARQGSLLTLQIAQLSKRPWLHLNLERGFDPIAVLADWLRRLRIRTLNVAGSRESSWPGIQLEVKEIVRGAIRHPLARSKPPKPSANVFQRARRSAP